MEWLTVETVENLQQALRLGVDIRPHVGSLRHATLPGLVEYGCLRYATQNDSTVPPLPTAVIHGDLGRALAEIRSPLGVRTGGPQKPDPKSMAPREIEFYALEGTTPTLAPAWEDFLLRFVQSATRSGFSTLLADGISATLHEMAENVHLHADSPAGAVVGYHIAAGVAGFTVADGGIGVLTSLRANPDYAQLHFHGDALRAVLRDHASRFGSGRGGNGFRQLFKSLADQNGELRFRTGEARVSMSGELSEELGKETFGEPLPGFQISVFCRTNQSRNVPLI